MRGTRSHDAFLCLKEVKQLGLWELGGPPRTTGIFLMEKVRLAEGTGFFQGVGQ